MKLETIIHYSFHITHSSLKSLSEYFHPLVLFHLFVFGDRFFAQKGVNGLQNEVLGMLRHRLFAEASLLHHFMIQICREHFHEIVVGSFKGLENFIEFSHKP